MIEPTHADIGRTVIYRAFPGDTDETGVIVSFTGAFVLVRFARFGNLPISTLHESLYWPETAPE